MRGARANAFEKEASDEVISGMSWSWSGRGVGVRHRPETVTGATASGSGAVPMEGSCNDVPMSLHTLHRTHKAGVTLTEAELVTSRQRPTGCGLKSVSSIAALLQSVDVYLIGQTTYTH